MDDVIRSFVIGAGAALLAGLPLVAAYLCGFRKGYREGRGHAD